MILEDFSNLGYFVILSHLYITLTGRAISHSGITTYPLWCLFWFDLFSLYAALLLNFTLLTEKTYLLGFQNFSLVKNSEIDPYWFHVKAWYFLQKMLRVLFASVFRRGAETDSFWRHSNSSNCWLQDYDLTLITDN